MGKDAPAEATTTTPFYPPRLKSPVTEDDRLAVRQTKVSLNRLGFYAPDPKEGMTDEIDADFIDALYAFQRIATIFPDDVAIGPGTTTERILHQELNKQDANAMYTWHTVGDGKVRGAHAAQSGHRFRK